MDNSGSSSFDNAARIYSDTLILFHTLYQSNFITDSRSKFRRKKIVQTYRPVNIFKKNNNRRISNFFWVMESAHEFLCNIKPTI